MPEWSCASCTRRSPTFTSAPARSERNTEAGPASSPIRPILERKRPAVRFGDLAAQDQADARSAGLRREERHEQVPFVRQAGALVVHPEVEHPAVGFPAD